MDKPKVLISGAGIAGLTLAYFLHEKGFEPIVIEKADSLRNNGYMIDFFSSGVYVAEQMGLLSELQRRDHHSNRIQQFTEKGKKSLSLDISTLRNLTKGKLFNFLRTDLVDILYQKIKDLVNIRFNQSITEITQTEREVKVTFEDGQQESFDYVVGADGIHSNVRRLVYSRHEVKVFQLGYYVAGLIHNVSTPVKKGEVLSMLCPKRQIMTYTSGDGMSTSLFVFKSDPLPRLNHREKVDILYKEFADFIHPVPDILSIAEQDPNLYFDEVSQIKIQGSWHKNRVALIGDAAYCITLLSGQGASMAMTGAYVLAEELAKYQSPKGFESYERKLRPTIEKMQKKAVKNAASYLPSTNFSLWLRNLLAPLLFSRLFAPLVIRQLGAGNYFKDA